MKDISKVRKEKLAGLEEKIGYRFEKKYLLNRAVTHSSYANQMGLSYIEHNERLEFLGDSVLSLVVSEYIFRKYKNKPEGKLSKLRASVVCEASLFEKAKLLNLGEYMLIGRGEELTGGRERASVLADAFEALIAAIYIDGGLECAQKFVLCQLSETIDQIVRKETTSDYKSRLQEFIQRDQEAIIKYEVIGEEGPAHNKTFKVSVSINGETVGRGFGKSKKQAEQEAAKSALVLLGDLK